VRGAISNGSPYRDLIDRLECCSDPTSSHFSALEPLPALVAGLTTGKYGIWAIRASHELTFVTLPTFLRQTRIP
jgi:hypothetical protein